MSCWWRMVFRQARCKCGSPLTPAQPTHQRCSDSPSLVAPGGRGCSGLWLVRGAAGWWWPEGPEGCCWLCVWTWWSWGWPWRGQRGWQLVGWYPVRGRGHLKIQWDSFSCSHVSLHSDPHSRLLFCGQCHYMIWVVVSRVSASAILDICNYGNTT